MAELQGQSEELRNTYARDGQPNQIEPEDPPGSAGDGDPDQAVRRRGPRRARGRAALAAGGELRRFVLVTT